MSDNDRLALDNLGLSLSASGAERMLMEQETIYKALACPTESLLLSCHLAGADGKEMRPSYLLGAFRLKLPGLPVETGAGAADADRLCARPPGGRTGLRGPVRGRTHPGPAGGARLFCRR